MTQITSDTPRCDAEGTALIPIEVAKSIERQFVECIRAHPECFPMLSPEYQRFRREVDSFLASTPVVINP